MPVDFNLVEKTENVVKELEGDLLKLGKEQVKKSKQFSQYQKLTNEKRERLRNLLRNTTIATATTATWPKTKTSAAKKFNSSRNISNINNWSNKNLDMKIIHEKTTFVSKTNVKQRK